MKIGFFQYAVVQRDREANYAHIAQAVGETRADLLVLPELFTCGYAFERREEVLAVAEILPDSPTVAFLQGLAARIGGVIVGTIPEMAQGALFNTAVVVGADGLLGMQRKIHLPEYEKRFFSPGEHIELISCSGVHIGIMTCFDCWFPAFSACLTQKGVQIICNPASFGGEVTPTILPIRARESQAFVVSCNRIGAENFSGSLEAFCGKSQILSPDGQLLGAGGDGEKLCTVEIDLAEIDHPAFGALICRDFPAEHRRYCSVLLEMER